MNANIVVSFAAMIGMAATASAQPALKDAFRGDFLIGTALSESLLSQSNRCDIALVPAQFNSISPENVLKWSAVHPEPSRYNFAPADDYVAFGLKHRMFIIGHTLVWHHQTPRWVFQDDQGNPVDRDTLLNRMREHITTVVGRYKGKINGWDVVNEALDEDGRLRRSSWLRILGEDYILKAFQFAHEADPKAELYYNDFSIENAPKRKGAIALIRKLEAAGVKVHGVGLQGHYKMDWPTTGELDQTIREFAALGVTVSVTELDMDVLPAATASQAAEVSFDIALESGLNPYTNGLPESVQQALAKRYADLFGVFVRNARAMERVTFWGVTDRSSWLNNWPVRGRTSYPLLFDRECNPKPAFDAVLRTADKGK